MATQVLSILTDFGGNFSLTVLDYDLRQSIFQAKYEYINVSGDTVTIFLSSALVGVEITDYDFIILNHDSDKKIIPLPDFFKIYVSPDGSDDNDGRDPKSAVSSINRALELVNEKSGRYIIHLSPDTHFVDNTSIVTIPDNVVLRGDSLELTVILPTNNSNNLFSIGGRGALEHFTISGVSGATAITINGNIYNHHILDMYFVNCQRSIYYLNCTGVYNIDRCNISGVNQYGIVVENSTVQVNHTYIVNSSICGIQKLDTSVLTLNTIQLVSCVIGLNITKRLQVFGINTDTCTKGIRFSDTDLDIFISTFYSRNCTTDFEIVTGSTGDVIIPSSAFSRRRVILNSINVNLITQFFDDLADTGLSILGEISIGSYLKPCETAFGAGDSTTQSMVVFTENGGVFTDVTNDVISIEGTFIEFPSVSAGSRIYIGGDFPFNGLKINVLNPVVLGVSGQLDWEYGVNADPVTSVSALNTWTKIGNILKNNATIPFAIQVRNANPPYTCYNVPDGGPTIRYPSIFNMVGSEQVRFGYTRYWEPTTVNSVSKYWFRINVAANITTSPQIDRIKLGTNRYEINEDGTHEMFGTARTLSKIPDLNFKNFTRNLTFGNPPNGNIDFSTRISMNLVDSVFSSGVERGITSPFRLPEDMDTSMPIEITVDFIIDSATTADTIDLTLEFGRSNTGDTIDGTNTTKIVYPANATTDAVSGVNTHRQFTTSAFSQQRMIFLVNLEDTAVTPDVNGGIDVADTIWISINRDGANDTYTGTITLFAIEGYYFMATVNNHKNSINNLFL